MMENNKNRSGLHRDEWFAQQPKVIDRLWEELRYLRHQPLKKSKYAKQIRLDHPVAMFSKEERLKTGMGTEITLIFRSLSCSWARSDSGGCTMCGYWNDRAPDSLTVDNLRNQFLKCINRYEDLLNSSDVGIVFKMFTSGSFCDPKEFPVELQQEIIGKLCSYPIIREIVIESRPEYISDKILQEYQNILTDQYLEIGIGLESSDDFTRTNIINKGYKWGNFVKATELLHKYNFGVKGYLLFKPPFVGEYAGIMDTLQSMRDCIRLGVDTISINPTNIQMHTLCHELEKRKAFRPPWLYSVLWLLKHGLRQEELSQTRIICDPSAAGKERGIHNCVQRDLSNGECLSILHKFVQSQDLSVIPESFSGLCIERYYATLLLE